jgi:hypothetical protein
MPRTPASGRGDPVAEPLSDEALQRCRDLLAELQAGHPSYQGQNRDDLLPWQREQYSFWALNIEGCLASYVPGLLARIDAEAAATPKEDT